MAQSDFVYDSGTPIDIGSHGEHDYVFHSGEPVVDTGESTLVYESGTGMGGGGTLIYRMGDDSNNFTDSTLLGNIIKDELDTNLVQVHESEEELDTALDRSTFGLVAVTSESDTDRLSSAEMSALSDWWQNDAVQGLLVLTEHGERSKTGNDAIEACVGSRPYAEGSNDSYARVSSGSACTTNVPTGLYPPLDGINEFYGYSSEATTYDPNADEGVFWTYDPSDGPRIYADGTYTRYGDAYGDACADSKQYIRQTIEWLDRQI